MLNAIAIDDEPFALEVIKSLTDKIQFINMEGYYNNTCEAVALLENKSVDLMFLDIRMPGLNGLEFLKSMPNPPMVIFTTAYDEHAVEGFEVNAVDYLLKPFSLTRFLKACNKAYEQKNLRNDLASPVTQHRHFYLKSGYENIRIETDTILYAEGLGNYVQLVLTDKKVVTRLTMNEVEALLCPSGFLRIHRSYIVSLHHVQRFDNKSIWVRQTELPIGPLYRPRVEKTFISR